MSTPKHLQTLKHTGQGKIIYNLLLGVSFFCALRSHWQESVLGTITTASQRAICFCFSESTQSTQTQNAYKNNVWVIKTVPDRKGSFLALGGRYMPDCKAWWTTDHRQSEGKKKQSIMLGERCLFHLFTRLHSYKSSLLLVDLPEHGPAEARVGPAGRRGPANFNHFVILWGRWWSIVTADTIESKSIARLELNSPNLLTTRRWGACKRRMTLCQPWLLSAHYCPQSQELLDLTQ